MALNNPSLLIQTGLSILARFSGVGLNFLVIILLTRRLPESEAGVILLLMTLITGVSLFCRLGLEQWLVRDVSGLDSDPLIPHQSHYLRSAYRLLFISSLGFITLWVITTPFLTKSLFDEQISTSAYLAGAFGMLCFSVSWLNAAFMKATHRITESLLTQNALPAIILLLFLLFDWRDFGESQRYLWWYIASLFVAAVISFIVIKAWWPTLKNNDRTDQSAKNVFQASWPLAPISIVAYLMLFADTLMAGLLLTNDQVALYTIAVRISFITAFFLTALEATLYPRLGRLHNQAPERLAKFFWQGTLLVIGLLSAVTGVIALFGQPILSVFKESYTASYTALLWLLFGQLIRGFSLTFSLMFILKKRTLILNRLMYTALALNLAGNFLLIPKWGIEGAAIATMTANCALTLGVMIWFFKDRLLSESKA